MCNSVIFSERKIESLNKYIRENIDTRLYLFAYYSPKSKGSKFAELDFWKGVTNIYGLFQDCAAFIKRDEDDLLNVFVKYDVVKEIETKKLRDFINKLNALRTVFSHNVCMEYSKDAYNMRLCQEYFSNTLKEEILLNKVTDIILKEEQWKVMLDTLNEEVENHVNILNGCLYEVSKSTQKDAIIEEWIKLILEWYKRKFNDLLYRAIYNQFQLYCMIHMKSGRIYDKKTPVNKWILYKKDDILRKMDDINIAKDGMCILPIEFFNSLIMETEPYKFWDDYYNTK